MDSILSILIKLCITVGVVLLCMVPYRIIIDDRTFGATKFKYRYDKFYVHLWDALILYIVGNGVIGVIALALFGLLYVWTR